MCSLTRAQMSDAVNHPSHYLGHYRREVIELTEKCSFCCGNALKYILRARWKRDEIEDLEKSVWYFNRMLKIRETQRHAYAQGAREILMEFVEDEHDPDYKAALKSACLGKWKNAVVTLNLLIIKKRKANE